ncbi:MAG: His-Xaa-Ser system protein HxsD [Clostridia bacterium]|nr:His-Xaa-Ser system protein HxsD [Clostridia bacterium]
MEQFYKIKNGFVEIEISNKIYPLVSVKKAISNFFEDAYIKLESNKDEINILLRPKENDTNLEQIVGEFYNELLRESLRYNISLETKNLRELIVGRALYTTCIDIDKEIENSNEPIEHSDSNIDAKEIYSIEDIAINWFEQNDKEE